MKEKVCQKVEYGGPGAQKAVVSAEYLEMRSDRDWKNCSTQGSQQFRMLEDRPVAVVDFCWMDKCGGRTEVCSAGWIESSGYVADLRVL